MTQQTTETYPVSTSTRGVKRWAIQMIIGTVIFGTILFLSAGRLNWVEGWVYLVMNSVTQFISAIVLTSRNPDLLTERSGVGKRTKSWDQYLSIAVAVIAPLAIMITAGLDARFQAISIYGSNAWVFGIVLAFLCQMFVLWAMASNPFFALTVRIQDERGHSVVHRGPYQLVRHPGYLGSILFSLLCPLVLGSKWVALPALLSCILIIIRTGLEDTTLHAELPGYGEYASKVRWRLFPGIW
ncbi:MAG: isoprenylcysteine carboxylmethyltransferase family protein [Anaerolineales bacterium]